MAANVFQCPQCSQLNTTRSIACKKCGANLQQVLDSINAKNRSTLILDIIVIVAVLGVIAVAVPNAFSRSPSSPLSNARGIGYTISATIQAEHSDYLINGTDYTASSAIAGTAFTGGIKATTGVPGDREISAVSPTTIRFNYENKIYEWDYIPRNGNIAAYMAENSDSDF
jgi:hypothetical protein